MYISTAHTHCIVFMYDVNKTELNKFTSGLFEVGREPTYLLPLDPVPSCVWGKNLPFFPPLA